jgi:hypothetical protein
VTFNIAKIDLDMKLSFADREAIESQLDECELSGNQVWTVSLRLEESLITLTADITSLKYTVTLTEDDQPVRTTTIVAGAGDGTTKGTSRAFLRQADSVLQSLIAGISVDFETQQT